jgi:hypothetical protein
LRLHVGKHEADRAHGAEEVDLQGAVPVGVGEGKRGAPRPVARGVDQRVDPAPAGHGAVHETAEVVLGLVGAGDAPAPDLKGERLALAGGGQDGDLIPLGVKLAGGGGTHAGAGGCEEGDLGQCGHHLTASTSRQGRHGFGP